MYIIVQKELILPVSNMKPNITPQESNTAHQNTQHYWNQPYHTSFQWSHDHV